MKHILVATTLIILLSSCSSKQQTTAEALESLENRYEKKIGSATKSDFVSEFGNPEWCKLEPTGTEMCRFYSKKGVRWIGESNDKKSVELFDEVVASFDAQGVLRTYKAKALR